MREKGKKRDITREAQEFYRILEKAVADALPGGASEYRRLLVRVAEKDVPLWEALEGEVSSRVSAWPEWSALLSARAKDSPQRRPQGTFKRYKKSSPPVKTPGRFAAFNSSFRKTSRDLAQIALKHIKQAALYSLHRLEKQPDYRKAARRFEKALGAEKLKGKEEALPLLDIWRPTRLAGDVRTALGDSIRGEVNALKNLAYPYDEHKTCAGNVALLMRVQVQIVQTYRDRLSRLVAAAESEFSDLLFRQVLRAEILPRVRALVGSPQKLREFLQS